MEDLVAMIRRLIDKYGYGVILEKRFLNIILDTYDFKKDFKLKNQFKYLFKKGYIGELVVIDNKLDMLFKIKEIINSQNFKNIEELNNALKCLYSVPIAIGRVDFLDYQISINSTFGGKANDVKNNNTNVDPKDNYNKILLGVLFIFIILMIFLFWFKKDTVFDEEIYLEQLTRPERENISVITADKDKDINFSLYGIKPNMLFSEALNIAETNPEFKDVNVGYYSPKYDEEFALNRYAFAQSEVKNRFQDEEYLENVYNKYIDCRVNFFGRILYVKIFAYLKTVENIYLYPKQDKGEILKSEEFDNYEELILKMKEIFGEAMNLNYSKKIEGGSFYDRNLIGDYLWPFKDVGILLNRNYIAILPSWKVWIFLDKSCSYLPTERLSPEELPVID